MVHFLELLRAGCFHFLDFNILNFNLGTGDKTIVTTKKLKNMYNRINGGNYVL